MEKEELFQLSKKLEYSEDGDFQKTATITMLPPTMATAKEASALGQYVMRAVGDARGTVKEDIDPSEAAEAKQKLEDEGMDAAAVRIILFSAKSVQFGDIMDEFKKLAVKVCKVSDKTFIAPLHMEKMEYQDFVKMTCEYIAFFITPSLF
jgi:hypothetical protein